MGTFGEDHPPSLAGTPRQPCLAGRFVRKSRTCPWVRWGAGRGRGGEAAAIKQALGAGTVPAGAAGAQGGTNQQGRLKKKFKKEEKSNQSFLPLPRPPFFFFEEFP